MAKLFKMRKTPHPSAPCGLKVGDKVTFTNDYGAVFPGKTVTGFCEITTWGASVYFDGDAYWHPVKVTSLKKEVE